ncbi:nucleoside triphosphate pyrophosphohydrolase [Shewanella oneidensis MR-1]|uniref:Nucleoside triphosphate pyrophosphohydrolase n=1 Tax=Shewanella oneidensis (strain ATCC 700550 / JCM 31522 / CIP 106686 / LMG 19005 / NCIMB 14063 / MR-1) TaxID=211586 RepID=Q8EBQ8_SHEON|nr:nucleoside triphosphate pyrophosphohydrolase [Shewanella oneidensis]AAN56439.2 nucleoside triphosphate pyrophosphohydrolase [Shewanella oneidensis MR-1]MDX5999151.1 nucleoside triphosphate pyrophosphohydrolase [Shewanella oneidensis]MEE2028312.1 Nucleoside triphosphate pyrophosphohydrolase [Shewanella oneidensis]QKG97831.1 nucleoside triphosphate pyrophosphohydrolase [Shewanella oneidensis MR-1]
MTSHTTPSTTELSATELSTKELSSKVPSPNKLPATAVSATDVAPLLKIMEKLRDPQTGCPWDKAQTFQTIVPFTLEEAYEVADTIERLALDELPDELGDLLFQVVFYCQLGKEQGRFDFSTVVNKIIDKLTRRHPHVFGEAAFEADASSQQMKANWEAIKASEREQKALVAGGNSPSEVSVLDDIPRAQPALSRSIKIQQRVARVGFDWPELEPVVAKIHEEIDEVLFEVNQPMLDQAKVQAEMGDLLFAVVNLARHLTVDPEQALRQANIKFERRFKGVEACARQNNKALEEHSLEELDAYWDKVKQGEPR